ncbi:MAG: Zn-finger nucleic acid-binding protein [Myxococcota bacterium]|jgi:Zn-finger nucleic acid-binding protein
MSDNKNEQEEEFFHRQDQEKLRQLREAAAEQKAEEHEAALKALHYFHCGKCGHQMKTQVFRGLDIEICSHCGAVLLDPGELEELVGEDKGSIARNLAAFFHFTKERKHD